VPGSLPGFEHDVDVQRSRDEWAERDETQLGALENLIGSAPGLAAATNLQSLRDEWEAGPSPVG
jgi:hypothetical protein